jgi:hypothetical protein
MSIEPWIVLGVGIATVASQWYSARSGGRVAARQATAAEAQASAAAAQAAVADAALERETSARFVATRANWDTDTGRVTLYNAGESAATDIRMTCLNGSAEPFADGWCPMAPARSSVPMDVTLGSYEKRDLFGSCAEVELVWVDGRGDQGPGRFKLFK